MSSRPSKTVAFSVQPTIINTRATTNLSLTYLGSGTDALRGQLSPEWTPPTISMMNTETITNDGSNFRNYDGKMAIIDVEYPVMGQAGVELQGYQGYEMTFVIRVAYTDGSPSNYTAADGHSGPNVATVHYTCAGPMYLATPGGVGPQSDAVVTFTQEVIYYKIQQRRQGAAITQGGTNLVTIREIDVVRGINKVRTPGAAFEPGAIGESNLLDLNDAITRAVYPKAVPAPAEETIDA